MTIHSTKPCVQCDATKRNIKKSLTALGLVDDTIVDTGGEVHNQDGSVILKVIVIDGVEAEEAIDKAKNKLGVSDKIQAPLVFTDERTWTGFHPDEIKYFFADAAKAMAKDRTVTITVYQASSVPTTPAVPALMSA